MADSPQKGPDFKEIDPIAEIGNPGFRQSAGIIQEEFLEPLKWPKANAVYKEMQMNDPIIGGILFAMEMIIRKVDWSVKSNGDEEKAEFLESCMHDMTKSWADTINDILSFLAYGYSIQEIVYKKRLGPKAVRKFRSKYNDGLWGWSRLPTRSQDTIVRWKFEGDSPDTSLGANFGDTTDLIGVVQRLPNVNFVDSDVFIPRSKFLLFRNNTKKDNPESTSILRNAYRSWVFKKTIEEIEAIGIERNLQGVPIAKIPPQYLAADATQEQIAVRNSVLSILANMKDNKQAGILWPLAYDETGNELYKFELLTQAGNSKVMDTTTVIQRYSSNIAQSVLADFILLGQQSVGSFALSSNKTKLFHSAISAWLDSIASVFNKEAVPALYEMNGWEQDARMPELTYGKIAEHSLEELGEYFKKIGEADLVEPTEQLETFLLDKADVDITEKKIPLLTKDEKMNSERVEGQKQIAEMQQDSSNETDFTPDNADG